MFTIRFQVPTMTRRPLVALLAVLLALVAVPASPAQFKITTPVNFAGNSLADGIALNGGPFAPPDTEGSVGLQHYVEFTNGTFAIYSKSNGALVGSKISDTTFWTNSGISSNLLLSGISDPRIIFDPSSNRWFASEITTPNTRNRILLAVSNNADPTQGFKAVQFRAASGFWDFPTLGVDANGVFLGTNNFSNGSATGTFTGVSGFSIPKADLVGATPSIARLTRFNNLNANTVGFTLQGVTNFGAAPSSRFVAVSNSTTTFGPLQSTPINGVTGAGATLGATTTINPAAYTAVAPPAQQPGSATTIDSIDNRYGSVTYQVGSLTYLAHTVDTGSGRASIRWTVLNGNNVYLEGTITDPNPTPHFDFFMPSVTANPSGVMVIGFNRSGDSTTGSAGNVSAFARVIQTTLTGATGSVLFDSGNILLAAGTTGAYSLLGSPERWGDYSSISPDPSNPNAFWTAQEIPVGANSWGTQITEILVSPAAVPEPTSLVLTGLGAGALLAGVWRRRAKAHQGKAAGRDVALTPA
ncbi:hypothetical protein AYO44_06470 [Planctomycetaceae bacterium SCGC AG-212-F19]|nr:hypothetical protein AYO44_06470 [Planctomycetaceae bacterium SCGC AG-212-F19]